MSNQSRVLLHYDTLGASYGSKSSDGLFHRLRQREVKLVLRLLAPTPGETLLDAGAGSGIYSRPLAEHGLRVTAVDISDRMMATVRPYVAEALVEDIEQMKLGRRFQAILCAGVLEFVESPARCLENLVNHLEQHGRLLLLVPRRTVSGLVYQQLHRRRGINARLFSPREVDALAEQLGLRRRDTARPFFHNQILMYQPRP